MKIEFTQEQAQDFIESMSKCGFDPFHREYLVNLIEEKRMVPGDTITIQFTDKPHFPDEWFTWITLLGVKIN